MDSRFINTSAAGLGTRARPGSRSWWLITALLAAAVVIGLYARFAGLGERPLAIDEYYSAKAVEFILDRGVPAFPDGGYYARGPVFHYLAAASAKVFGPSGFGYRLPSVIFSLITVGLAYLYARRFVSVPVAVAVAVALLLSSWQIEFARFVRMYALFQAVTLLFLIALDDAFFRGRWGRRYLPHGLAVLATLSHQLGVLLTPLLFLPFLTGVRAGPLAGWRSRIAFGAAGLLTVLVCLVIAVGTGDLRVSGTAVPPLPDGYAPRPGLYSPLAVPAFPFWQLPGDPWTTLAAVALGAAALAAGLLALRRWRGVPVRDADILLALLVLFSLAHLFVLCGLVLLILLLRYDLHRPDRHPKRAYALLALAALIGAGWLAYALASPDLLAVAPAIALRWDMAEAGLLKALWTTFLGWPDFYPSTIRPFAREMPVLGLLAAAALAYALAAHRRDPLPALLRHPGFFVAYTAAVFGVVSADWSTSRYWFHAYPVVLCLIALAAEGITGGLAARARRTAAAAPAAAALGFLAAFALTSDFNPRHLLRAGTEEVAFRSGPFAPFAPTWYPRLDVAAPAAFVDRTVEPGAATRIVVENLPAASYYLADDEHAIYYHRESARFRQVGRERGTRDLWSGMRLLSTPGELAAYTRPAREVWLIREVERSPLMPEPEEVWGERLVGRERAFLSRDGRVEVLRLELAPPPPGAEGAAGGGATSSAAERPADRRDDERLGLGVEVGVHR